MEGCCYTFNIERKDSKSIDNLLDAIEKSKNNSLEKLLFGLGIKEVGAKMAKTLAKKFVTLDALMEISEEELIQIDDIGPVVSRSIVNYFNNDKNKEIIAKHSISGAYIQASKRFAELSDLLFNNKAEFAKKLQELLYFICYF